MTPNRVLWTSTITRTYIFTQSMIPILKTFMLITQAPTTCFLTGQSWIRTSSHYDPTRLHHHARCYCLLFAHQLLFSSSSKGWSKCVNESFWPNIMISSRPDPNNLGVFSASSTAHRFPYDRILGTLLLNGILYATEITKLGSSQYTNNI